MKSKLFYRIANLETQQGLWYDFNGKFTGLIHSKFKFCLNSNLPMPFNTETIGWLSATDSFDELLNWFPIPDILRLQHHGYLVTVYEAVHYRVHNNHWLIQQNSSRLKETLPLWFLDPRKQPIKDNTMILEERLSQLFKAHGKFSDATFGKDRSPLGPLNHLLKEVQETIDQPEDREEYADCLLLLIDAFRLSGNGGAHDLLNAAFEKLEKNKKRAWGKPNKDGVFQHIKQSS